MKQLLILHGWGSNSLRWQKVKELLEEKGIEVLVLDLPGFGIEPSPKEVWGINEYVNWISQKVKDYNPPTTLPPEGQAPKGWQKFNLLGHSFGGGLAVKMAAENPNLIGKLILCAPAIIRRKKGVFKTKLFYWVAFLGKKIFSLPGLQKFQAKSRWLIYKLARTRDYYFAQGIMKEIMKKILKELNLPPLLEKIEIPTLIIWGKKDNVLPIKDAYLIKEKIKNSKLKIIPKARHSLHREAPEELAEAIIQFLKY